MPYIAEISRTSPSAFLFLIDQSGSMQDALDPTDVKQPTSVDGPSHTHSATGRTKAAGVADAINRLLRELTITCAKSEGIRDYYHVGVIGYGGDSSANRVAPAFAGALAGRELVPISEIANNPARIEERTKMVEDGEGGLLEQKVRFPVWFDAVASGGTPMGTALTTAHSILGSWVTQHPGGFPPICINISDGESNEDDPPMQAAEALKTLSTSDGNVLLFNIHLSSLAGTPVEFPESDSALPDQFAKLLFSMSSVLPEHMQSIARQEGMHVTEMSRGFAFNADMISLIRFLDIGTRPANLR